MTQIDTNKLVTVDNLTWGYPSQRILFHEFDFQLSKGDFCFVVGDSGSGKTSLMKLITGQIQAPAHSVYIQGEDVSRLSTDEVQALRRRLGVIYQDYKLLVDRSVIENITLPLHIQGIDEKAAHEHAKALAQEFNFVDKLHTKVSFLSGGEKQKVAIMRALITLPQFIIADEPTGNLDWAASTMIADMLIHCNKKGHTILFITHDQNLIGYVQNILPGVRVVSVS